MDKIVDKIVDKIFDKIFDKIVDKIVEKIFDKILDKIVDKKMKDLTMNIKWVYIYILPRTQSSVQCLYNHCITRLNTQPVETGRRYIYMYISSTLHLFLIHQIHFEFQLYKLKIQRSVWKSKFIEWIEWILFSFRQKMTRFPKKILLKKYGFSNYRTYTYVRKLVIDWCQKLNPNKFHWALFLKIKFD